MVNPVGYRFRPSDEEIVDHYLRPKNLDSDTSHVDEVISTVDICSLDPWDLPSKSRIRSSDHVWYYFGRKENKYNRGGQQRRKTKSGFWKKTGVTMNITRRRGNCEKIGEKKVLVFHFSKINGGSKSDWVMHEYHATPLSPNQRMMTTYTICKVEFKGEETEMSTSSSSSAGCEFENTHSSIPLFNNSGGSEVTQSFILNNSGGLNTETEVSSFHTQELQNPTQSSGFLDVHEEAPIVDANTPIEEWKTWLLDDEQINIVLLQDDRNDYRPPKSLTGVFTDDYTTDDNHSGLISATTNSIQTSSACDSFGSSNRRIDQTIDLQESPSSTIKLVSLTQEVSQTIGTSIDKSEKKKENSYHDAQGAEIGEHKLGQETIKNKRAGFFYRTIQKLVKKFHLCSWISRT